MPTKLIVTNYKNFKCGVKLNEGELVNIRFQPNQDVQIGDIYKVKVTEILPNDSGAFVTYGSGDQRGFFKRINLPNGDKAHEGQTLLLQVRSIGSKDKVHLFTNNIILTGKFINLLRYGDEIILSRRTRKNLGTNQQDQIMDALINDYPEYWQLRVNSGYIKNQLLDATGSEKRWNEALDIYPNSYEALRSLAFLHIETGDFTMLPIENRDLEKAENYFERIREIDPNSSRPDRYLGNIYRKQNDLDKALAALNPDIPNGVVAISAPPVNIRSASP